MGNQKIFVRSPARVNDDISHTLSFWRRNTDISYSFDGGAASTTTLGVSGTVEFGVIMKIILGFPANNKQFNGCMLGFDYNGMTPLENTHLPNIKKSPGLIEGSCESNPVTSPPEEVTTKENDSETTKAKGDDNNSSNNNKVETVTPKPVYDNNSTTVQTQIKGATGLGLPIIMIIAVGGFLLILAITYGVSRFARRRQGVYKTNEDKRATEHQRVEYDKLTIHDEAFELPPKRELYM